ncbi:putative xanthine dehydrogenase subunit A [Thalassocella blandensis]|nr:putative xanthine dehydrogenase subunit A [Thalassocella blandensis]
MINASCIEVFTHLLRALERDQDCYLISVISTWGSSPRPPGALMLWSESDGVIGSVSGGCVEEDLIERLRQGEFTQQRVSVVLYGGTSAENTSHNKQAQLKPSIALPCGGTLQLVLEHLQKEDLPRFKEATEHLQKRQGLMRQIDLDSGEWLWQSSTFQPTQCQHNIASVFLGPARKLLIIGANQVAWYLAAFANSLDFAVTVCDPSVDLASHWFNADFTMLQTYPDDEVMREFSDPNCAVVAVSHDPRLDDMALLDALPGEAFYVGAMGSMATSKSRIARLREFNLTPTQLAKLHAPIGLDIGSKTPAEIAISIASQLVQQYKTQQHTQQLPDSAAGIDKKHAGCALSQPREELSPINQAN